MSVMKKLMNSKKIGNNVYKVLCTASLDDFREYFDLDDEEELDVTTVNGWITEVTGIIPGSRLHIRL